MLGVPEADQPRLLDWLDAGIEDDSPSILSPEAMRHIRGYAVELIAAKRATPDEAIMSTIVHARGDDGRGLSDDELIAFFALLFPAGSETTRSALAGAVLAFADHPDELDRLRADPSLVTAGDRGDRPLDDAVGVQAAHRQPRRRARRHAASRAGDKVTFWEMSANRDERAFADPFRFDVGRQPNPHLGFGWGTHFCLGAGLARLEIKVLLDLLVERGVRIERAGDIAWMPNNRLFGLKSLPVTMRAVL